MGIRTGKPRGRPPGAKSQHTEKRERAVQQAADAIAHVIPDAFEGDAHAYLMAVYKDPRNPADLRLDAAKAAIRYEKPALSSVDMKATVKRDIEEYSDAELIALAMQAARSDRESAEAPQSTH